MLTLTSSSLGTVDEAPGSDLLRDRALRHHPPPVPPLAGGLLLTGAIGGGVGYEAHGSACPREQGTQCRSPRRRADLDGIALITTEEGTITELASVGGQRMRAIANVHVQEIDLATGAVRMD